MAEGALSRSLVQSQCVFCDLEAVDTLPVHRRINRDIYTDDDDKISFVLSFMNEKEALQWKQTLLRFIMSGDDEMKFPPFKKDRKSNV